jgi:hypothetical protein
MGSPLGCFSPPQISIPPGGDLRHPEGRAGSGTDLPAGAGSSEDDLQAPGDRVILAARSEHAVIGDTQSDVGG